MGGNGGRDDLCLDDDDAEECEDDFRSREDEEREGEGDLSERFRVRAVRISSRLLWITSLYLSVRSLAQVSTSGGRSPDIEKVSSSGASFSNGDVENYMGVGVLMRSRVVWTQESRSE